MRLGAVIICKTGVSQLNGAQVGFRDPKLFSPPRSPIDNLIKGLPSTVAKLSSEAYFTNQLVKNVSSHTNPDAG